MIASKNSAFAFEKLYIADFPERQNKQVPAVVGKLVHYYERVFALPENVVFFEVVRLRHFDKRVAAFFARIVARFGGFDIRHSPI